jgi:hypothetical protein
MKTVKILIEVEVSDNAKQVAVDENGSVWVSYDKQMHTEENHGDSGFWVAENGNVLERRVSNWKETLTEVE